MAEQRRDIDDAALAARQHHAQRMLHAEHGAEHIGIEHLGDALVGLLGQRSLLAFRAGIVDHDIDMAEALYGDIDEIAHLLVAADIGADELRLGAAAAQFFGERGARLLAASRNDDLRAFIREGERRGAADAGERARDDDDLLAHDELLRSLRRSAGSPLNMDGHIGSQASIWTYVHFSCAVRKGA